MSSLNSRASCLQIQFSHMLLLSAESLIERTIPYLEGLVYFKKIFHFVFFISVCVCECVLRRFPTCTLQSSSTSEECLVNVKGSKIKII